MSQQDPTLSGRRVLVVEDELLVLMDVEDFLEELGCEVLESASTVEQALQRIAEDAPEVAILDLNLDGQTTLPVAEALRNAGIPFIVVTGYVDIKHAEPVLRDAAMLQKPCSGEQLQAGLRKVFE
jgi:CheY-like chemotaxis protein